MRRQFFKRPSWASKENDEPSDFFRRSENTFAEIVAAAREEREKNLLASNSVASPAPAEDIEDRTVSASSANGVSPNIHNTHDDINPSPRSRRESPYPGSSLPNIQTHLSTHELVTGTRYSAAAGATECGLGSIELGPQNAEQSRFDEGTSSNARLSPSRSVLESVHAVPQKAPENGRQTHSSGGEFSNVRSSPAKSDNLDPLDQELEDDGIASDIILSRNKGDRRQDERAVQILITSAMENTKPLIVIRKMSQSLRDVRLAWIKRQNLPIGAQSSVILTWKGRRLFDVTTCRSLGIFSDPGSLADDGDIEPLRVHMEAITEEAFQSNSLRRSPSNAQDAESESEDVESEDVESEDVESDQPSTQMSIVLKCPGLGELKVAVEPNKQISGLIAEYRSKKGIATDQQISMLFDGERLDPNTSIQDHDIADDDMVDVQVK